MPIRLTIDRPSRRTTGPVLAAVFGALLLAGCQTGSDGFNDGSDIDEAPDAALVRGLMEGLGAVDGRSEAKIEYKPRAPLAMPARADALPPPEEPETVANWPASNKDAEIARIQEVYRNTGRGSAELDGDGRSTTVQSRGIQQLATSGRERDIQNEIRNENRLENGRMNPADLNKRVGAAKTASAFTADGTPVRRYLIEPPVEFSTPSADAPIVAPDRVDRRPEISATEQIMNGRSARTVQ
ncbi:hypothetical protein [Stappia sp.]|uniref:hypothetical protein n=1 Tax=Stappia sp. TaxID=1870903 RepID=UPI0032D964FC